MTEPVSPQPDSPAPEAATPAVRPVSWVEKLASVLFAIFCLELGLFLLVYPWLGTLWNRNFAIYAVPAWREVLLSEQVRGAVSGLGMLNVFIGLNEVVRLRRFAGR